MPPTPRSPHFHTKTRSQGAREEGPQLKVGGESEARDVLGVMGGAFFGQEAEFTGAPQLVNTLQQGGDGALPGR